MLEAFVIVLREGVEAALVVAILLAALKKAGRGDLSVRVGQGIAAAAAASLLGGFLLRGFASQEDVFEGALMLVAAVFVATMMWWMHRTAHRLKEHVESQVASAARGGGGAIFWVTFLLVAREGIEAVLFLSAASLDSTTLAALVGGGLGLLLAVGFGFAFAAGSLRIDLRRFFGVTNFVLGLLLVQLFVGGLHELGEALVIPVGPREMALIGPIVKNEIVFILAILLVPVYLRFTAVPPAADTAAEGPAARLARARDRRTRRGLDAAAAISVVIAVVLGVSFVRGETSRDLTPPAESVAVAQGQARIPVTKVADGAMHRFAATASGHTTRFLLMRVDGQVVAAFDACQICGIDGYNEDRGRIVCRHCDASINRTSFGHEGGCNPIPLASRVEGDFIVVSAVDLAREASQFPAAQGR